MSAPHLIPKSLEQSSKSFTAISLLCFVVLQLFPFILHHSTFFFPPDKYLHEKTNAKKDGHGDDKKKRHSEKWCKERVKEKYELEKKISFGQKEKNEGGDGTRPKITSRNSERIYEPTTIFLLSFSQLPLPLVWRNVIWILDSILKFVTFEIKEKKNAQVFAE